MISSSDFLATYGTFGTSFIYPHVVDDSNSEKMITIRNFNFEKRELEWETKSTFNCSALNCPISIAGNGDIYFNGRKEIYVVDFDSGALKSKTKIPGDSIFVNHVTVANKGEPNFYVVANGEQIKQEITVHAFDRNSNELKFSNLYVQCSSSNQHFVILNQEGNHLLFMCEDLVQSYPQENIFRLYVIDTKTGNHIGQIRSPVLSYGDGGCTANFIQNGNIFLNCYTFKGLSPNGDLLKTIGYKKQVMHLISDTGNNLYLIDTYQRIVAKINME